MDVTGVKEERVEEDVMSIPPPPMLPPMLPRKADEATVVPAAPPIP